MAGSGRQEAFQIFFVGSSHCAGDGLYDAGVKRNVLPPGKATNISVFLPDDGIIGRVAVLLPRLRSSDSESPPAICDQEIRCSRAFPDGTPEPAQLLLVEKRR